MSNYTDKSIGEFTLLLLNAIQGNEVIPLEGADDNYGLTLSILKTWIASNINHSDLKELLGDGEDFYHLNLNQITLLKNFSVSDEGELLYDNNKIGGEEKYLKLPNKSVSFPITIAIDTFIENISVLPITPETSFIIGITDGGSEILELISYTEFTPIPLQRYFAVGTVLYFTIVSGTFNLRMDYKINYIL